MHSSSMALAETGRRTVPPVERWSPPLDSEGLARIASLLRQMKPLEGIMDDIGDVLGEQDPRESEFGEIAERLRGDLLRFLAIANAAGDGDAQVCRLLQRAHKLRFEALPEDSRQGLGYLRRMAWAVIDLLERLAETNMVREVACRPPLLVPGVAPVRPAPKPPRGRVPIPTETTRRAEPPTREPKPRTDRVAAGAIGPPPRPGQHRNCHSFWAGWSGTPPRAFDAHSRTSRRLHHAHHDR